LNRLFTEKAGIRIKTSKQFIRGRERGMGAFRREGILTGIVRAQTQRVRIISGADRWSRVIIWEVEMQSRRGERMADEMGVRARRINGVCRHEVLERRRGVRVSGIRIFSIC